MTTINMSGTTAQDQAEAALAGKVVRYDVEQSLSNTQQVQARANIGAAAFGPNEIFAADYGLSASNPAAVNTAAWTAALDALDALGGGILRLPAGIIQHTGLTIGNGSNSAQSTKHHRIRIIGCGMGSSAEVSNTEYLPVTSLKYVGASGSGTKALDIAGPIHNVCLQDFAVDANNLADIGINVCHLSDFTFDRVSTIGHVTRSWVYTTRSSSPVGVAHGCGNGSVRDCNAFFPASNASKGILLTSTVAGSLVGQPDTANIDFYGGQYFYGASTGTNGLELSGADNNTFYGMQLLLHGGNDGGGSSIVFTQYPTSTQFPLENLFQNMGILQPITGTSGTSGNYFRLATSDGALVPSVPNVVTDTYDGGHYKNGLRYYRAQRYYAAISAVTVTNSTTTHNLVTGLSLAGVVAPNGSRVRITYQVQAAKGSAGSGFFIASWGGTEKAESQMAVGATGYTASACGCAEFTIGADTTATAQLNFWSSDTNTLTVYNGTITAEVFY